MAFSMAYCLMACSVAYDGVLDGMLVKGVSMTINVFLIVMMKNEGVP